MRINPNFVIQEVLGSKVLINLNNETNVVIKLNDTSFEIYNLLSKNKSKEEIIKYLENKYSVSKNILEKDYDEFIKELIDSRIVTYEK